MNPLMIPGLAQMPGLVEQGRNNFLSQLDAELKARQEAFRQIYGSEFQVPLEVTPNARVNKGAAIAGGIAALIGALTGDRSAVPGFAQFAGGLQQAQSQEQQRLMQEQMLKRQRAEQEIARKKGLLGFDLEMAQNKYQTEAQRIQAQRKLEFEAAEAERDRRLKDEINRRTQEGLTERNALSVAGREKLANLKAQGKMPEVMAFLNAPGNPFTFEQIVNILTDYKGKEASATLKNSQSDYIKGPKTKNTEADTLIKQRTYEQMPELLKIKRIAAENLIFTRNANIQLAAIREDRLQRGEAVPDPVEISKDREIALVGIQISRIDEQLKGHEARLVRLQRAIDHATTSTGFKDDNVRKALLAQYQSEKAAVDRDIDRLGRARAALEAKRLQRQEALMMGTAAPVARGQARTNTPIDPMASASLRRLVQGGSNQAPASLSGKIGR